MPIHKLKFAAALAFVAMLGIAPSMAAPEAKPWAKFEVHNDATSATIDQGSWDRFLQKYAHLGSDGIVRVGYGQVSPADKAELANDLARKAATPISQFRRAEQMVFWINLYNELTVKFVVDRYPLPSIKDSGALAMLFSANPFTKKLITIEGEELSLDDIEHRILRPGWRDPRIHYTLNCASLGCPNLQTRAYTVANAEAMLDGAARQYVNHPRAVAVVGGKLNVSSIYVWYKADFGGTDEGVIFHLKRYAGPQLQQALSGVDHISDHHYDWSLNDQAAQ